MLSSKIKIMTSLRVLFPGGCDILIGHAIDLLVVLECKNGTFPMRLGHVVRAISTRHAWIWFQKRERAQRACRRPSFWNQIHAWRVEMARRVDAAWERFHSDNLVLLTLCFLLKQTIFPKFFAKRHELNSDE